MFRWPLGRQADAPNAFVHQFTRVCIYACIYMYIYTSPTHASIYTIYIYNMNAHAPDIIYIYIEAWCLWGREFAGFRL